ncbi:MAG: hypothetical protein AAF327_17210 [Cyanobacteria bacterium P01_A01_bin.37]
MPLSRWLKRLTPLILSVALLLTACSAAPSKYDQVQEDTTGFRSEKAVDRQAENGSTFNQFFPGSQGNYEVVPAQEKAGFAEYKLKQDGETVAMLTINDTISLPAAAVKYENATESIAGYPSVNQGATATGILVNGRYQVKVLSRSDEFDQESREAWIQKFDLIGLAQLDAQSTSKIPVKPSPQNVIDIPGIRAPDINTNVTPQPAM